MTINDVFTADKAFRALMTLTLSGESDAVTKAISGMPIDEAVGLLPYSLGAFSALFRRYAQAMDLPLIDLWGNFCLVMAKDER